MTNLSAWELLRIHVDFAWLLEIGLTSLSWVILCHNRGQWKTDLWRYALLYAVMGLANLALFLLLNVSSSFFILWALLKGVIGYGFLRLFSNVRPRTRLLLWLSLWACSLAISALSGQCSFLVGEFIATGTLEGVVRTIVILFIPLVAVYLRHLHFDEHEVVPIGGLVMIGVGALCVLGLYGVMTAYLNADYRVTVTLLLSYLCMLIMILCAIQALYTLCRNQTAILRLQAEKTRMSAEREMSRMTEATLEDLRCVRHDLKNQYALMQILLAEKRYDELENYFAKLAANLPPQLSMVDCGNRTVNTILNMEFSKMREAGLVVEHQLVVPPVLPFPAEDLCAILANLLDNAAEECHRLLAAGQEETRLRLEVYPHQSYLYIRCLNPTDRTGLTRKKRGLSTTKGDERVHGYGTQIIARTAEKYNGCVDYTLSEGQFIAQVMLDMAQDTKEEKAS